MGIILVQTLMAEVTTRTERPRTTLVDDIDVMAIDADTMIAGNQAFRWVWTAPLTGTGQVGFFISGGNTIIHASNDADATAEFQIQLNGIKTLTVDDFYL